MIDFYTVMASTAGAEETSKCMCGKLDRMRRRATATAAAATAAAAAAHTATTS